MNFAMLAAVSSSPPDFNIADTMSASSLPVRGTDGGLAFDAPSSKAVSCASMSVHGIGKDVAFPRAAIRRVLFPASMSKDRSLRYRFSRVKHTIEVTHTDAQIISSSVTFPANSSSGE